MSIPILNEGGVPQISPSNTAVGLTSDAAGADKGEPDKYYPAGTRTYTRIVPKDTIQGAALATIMKEDGCTNVAIANDKEVYGAGLARNIESAAKTQGLKIDFNEGIDPKAANYRSLASKAKGDGVDCFAFSGTTSNNAAQIFKDFSAAIPDAKLYGPDGVAEAAFTDPKEGGIPASVGAKTTLTVATLAPDKYPPEGQQFFKQYGEKYGDKHARSVRDLRLRGDEPRARRHQARRLGRQGRRSSRRCSPRRIARACSARTRSTRTATRPSRTTASTRSTTAS